MDILKKIEQAVFAFPEISLQEMESVALMKRKDVKYIIHRKQLLEVLEAVKESYRILEIDHQRMMAYSSLYFDTPDRKFYHDHHKGKKNRTKIRIRNYVDSNRFFFEVKQKDARGNATKSRIERPAFEMRLSSVALDFIKKVTDKDYQDLKPTIINGYTRVTMVNTFQQERVTLDLNLTFKTENAEKSFDDLAIIEVKQEAINRDSIMVKALRAKGLRPFSISKYCIGMVSLYDDLKYNSFKQKLIKIQKMSA